MLFILFLFYRETFQTVKDTTTKLEKLNKRMIDESKKGEATRALEEYVWLHICTISSKSVFRRLSMLSLFSQGVDTLVSSSGTNFPFLNSPKALSVQPNVLIIFIPLLYYLIRCTICLSIIIWGKKIRPKKFRIRTQASQMLVGSYYQLQGIHTIVMRRILDDSLFKDV